MTDQTTNQTDLAADFRVGDWLVQPRLQRVANQAGSEKLEPKIMEALVFLASRAGETVTRDQLVERLWDGAAVTEDALNRSISKLRKVFGDDPKKPAVIETIPKIGYRLIAPVSSADSLPVSVTPPADVPHTTAHQNGAIEPANAAPPPVVRTTTPLRLGVWALALALLLTLVWLRWRPGFDRQKETPRNIARVVPLTSFAGLEIAPALSPDGTQAAFAWRGEANDNWDIYLKQIENERLTRLTSHTAREMEPAWSPDGKQIAFVRQSKTDCGIYAITPQGQAERQLTTCHPNSDVSLSWSPDGQWLAFTDKTALEAPAAVFLLAPATGERRQLTAPPADWLFGDTEAAFAPDGRTLAFARYSALGVADVFLVPTQGGEPRRLTFDNLKVHGLAWLPDGKGIVYSSNRGGSFGLWRASLAGGAPERIATDGRSAEQPTISARGKRLVYEQWLDKTNLWQINLGASVSVTEQAVTTSTRWDEAPQYSPDGQGIAFVSDRSGAAEVWVCNRNGTEARRLTSFNGPYVRAPRWSPDGTQIAFDTSAEGNFDVYVVNAAGGAPRRMMTDATEEHVADWSRDGRGLYFASNRSGSWQVWKMSAQGGAPVQITRNGGFAAAETPDGQWLYFTQRGQAGLWRMPVGGGPETLALDKLQPLDWLNWTLTNGGLYYVERAATDATHLAYFDLATGQRRLLAPLPQLLYKSGLSLAPDGRSLLYSKIEKREADLILVDDFMATAGAP